MTSADKISVGVVAVLFLLGFYLIYLRPFFDQQPLTDQDREKVENHIASLEKEIENVDNRISHRRSFGGLYDQIGSASSETFSDHYQNLKSKYREDIRNLKLALKLGVNPYKSSKTQDDTKEWMQMEAERMVRDLQKNGDTRASDGSVITRDMLPKNLLRGRN